MNKEDCDLYFTVYIIDCSVSENDPFFCIGHLNFVLLFHFLILSVILLDTRQYVLGFP